MSFAKLRAACRFVNTETKQHERFSDWEAKRDALVVLMQDLPTLVELHKNRRQEAYPGNPQITTYDPVPPVRLANACEATTNTLYGMSEIAANFGNKVSRGELPSSFNELRKKAQAGKFRPEVLAALGDLQWYEKVRELRTEWAHYSTVFIGEDKGEPLLVVKAYRRENDRKQFKGTLQCKIPDIITWTAHALATIDGFAGYLLTKYVLPSFDLEAQVITPKYDCNGYPLMTPDHRFEVETLTVRQILERDGVTPKRTGDVEELVTGAGQDCAEPVGG